MSRVTGWVRVGDDARRDIKWLIEFVEQFNGELLIPLSYPKVVLECGGFSKVGYYTVQFPIRPKSAMHVALVDCLRQWQVIVTHVPGVSLIQADALSWYTLSDRYSNIFHEWVGKRSLVKVKPVEVMNILDSFV